MTKLDELKAQMKEIQAEIRRIESSEFCQGQVKLNNLCKDGSVPNKILYILRKNYWDNSKGERYTKIIEARNYGQIVMSIDNLIDDLNKTKQAIIEEVGVE